MDMRAIVVCALIGVLVSACQFKVEVGKGPPPIRGNAEFGNVVLATEIDDYTKEPVTEVTEFPSDVEVMYATIHVKNVKAGEFRFQWKKGDEDAGAIVMTVPDIHDNWVSTWLEPTTAVPPGNDYSIDVLYNGKVISTATFKVIDSSTADST